MIPLYRDRVGLLPYSEDFGREDVFLRCDRLTRFEQIHLAQQRIRGQRWKIADLLENCPNNKNRAISIDLARREIEKEKEIIKALLVVPPGQEVLFGQARRQFGLAQALALVAGQDAQVAA